MTSRTLPSAACSWPRASAEFAASRSTPSRSGSSTSSPRAFGARVLRAPAPVDDVRRELDEYFEGTRRDFDLPVDLTPLPDFQRAVLEELVRVPYGGVDTYGGLAQRIGKPRAARAVGGALNRNPIPIVVPCHRIVGASGNLVGYAGGLERKQALLGLEGALLT